MEHSNPLHFGLWNPAITHKINLAIFFVAHFIYLEECKCVCVCVCLCICVFVWERRIAQTEERKNCKLYVKHPTKEHHRLFTLGIKQWHGVQKLQKHILLKSCVAVWDLTWMQKELPKAKETKTIVNVELPTVGFMYYETGIAQAFQYLLPISSNWKSSCASNMIGTRVTP